MISVLMPIYNARKYLEVSIFSVLNQSFSDIEIICIDDGSTDGSGNMLDFLAKTDTRIFVIHKENTGYGDSMNVGIDAAKGDYIGILEPDDFLEKDCYEKLYQAARRFDADVVKCNFYFYDSSTCSKTMNDDLHIVPYEKSVTQLPEMFLIPPAIWAGIYRKDFLIKEGVRFLTTPGASYQDTGFAFKTLLCAKRFVSIEDALINYRIDNEDSSVKDQSKILCICDEMHEIERFMMEKEINDMWGIYTRVKALRYQWNYDRLSGAAKEMFYSIAREEMREHERNGQIDRQFWSDTDWERCGFL